MHPVVRTGLAALSLGAVASAMGVATANAVDIVCPDRECEPPSNPGSDPYMLKITPVLNDVMGKFEASPTFNKVDIVLSKLNGVLGKLEDVFIKVG